jgi:hypothetical protein
MMEGVTVIWRENCKTFFCQIWITLVGMLEGTMKHNAAKMWLISGAKKTIRQLVPLKLKWFELSTAQHTSTPASPNKEKRLVW